MSFVDFRLDDSAFAPRAEPFRLGGEVPLAQVAIKAACQKGQGAKERLEKRRHESIKYWTETVLERTPVLDLVAVSVSIAGISSEGFKDSV